MLLWDHLVIAAFAAAISPPRALAAFQPRRFPLASRSRALVASAEPPDLASLVSNAEAFIEAEGIGFEDADRPYLRNADGRRSTRKQSRAPKRAPKPSKLAKLRVGCYGCGADLQITEPAAAGYVEPERYELKAAHRQLRLLLCRRCRALTQSLFHSKANQLC